MKKTHMLCAVGRVGLLVVLRLLSVRRDVASAPAIERPAPPALCPSFVVLLDGGS